MSTAMLMFATSAATGNRLANAIDRLRFSPARLASDAPTIAKISDESARATRTREFEIGCTTPKTQARTTQPPTRSIDIETAQPQRAPFLTCVIPLIRE
ncbi:hypothetical protein [Lysobacter sp. TAB13]|uniref:hypothetical protein n=1 Tax=Lysobacter sp. TAB13 TaxID=3233065 RepID=UPI003F9A3CA1